VGAIKAWGKDMRFRKMQQAAMLTMALLAGGAIAQAAQHDHGTTGGQAAKQQMTAKDLKARLDKGENVTIIDARHELGGQIIKGAIHVPSDKLDAWAKDADKNAVIVTYCTCPHDEAADAEVLKLLQMGFKKAYALTGGLDAARAAGIEVVSPGDK
jgi:rhodanese-related sulfurtransferase